MVAIPFSYNLGAAGVSAEGNSHGLIALESDGLHLDSGLEFFTGLEATSFYNFTNINIINNLEQDAPQTLTTAQFSNLQLIAGEKLVIRDTYLPGDAHNNDFAFSLLQDSSGAVTPVVLADAANYMVSVHAHQLPQVHFTTTYTIGATGTYNLMVASADVGDTQEPTTLVINSISALVPSGGFTLTDSGVQLSDGGFIKPDGSFVSSLGVAEPSLFSNGAAGLVTDLDKLVSSHIISQDGNGLIGEDGSSLIGEDGSSLIGEDGSSVFAGDIASLISQDGNTLVSHDGGSIISQDGNGLLSPNGTPLTGDIYSTFRLDALGLVTRDFTATPPPAPPPGPAVPGNEFLIGPSAVAPFNEALPAVAALSNGNFAVAWRATSGSQVSIQVQLETPGDAASGSQATIVPIATHSLGSTSLDPIVIGLSSGGFAVVYLEAYFLDVNSVVTTPGNVYAQLFDNTGAKLGSPTLLAATTAFQVSDLAATALPDGSFVTTATHYDYTSGVTSLVAERYTDSGATIGNAMTVATDAAAAGNINTQGQAITGLANGGFAVAFANVAFASGPNALLTGMYVQIFDSVGAVGAPILIRSSTSAVTLPAITTLTDGRFVVAWNEGGGTNNSTTTTVNAQVISATGTLIGSVISGVAGRINYDLPTVTALADGRFIVAYDMQDLNSTEKSVQAQVYNPDGTASGSLVAGNAPDGSAVITSPAIAQITSGQIELVSEHSGGAAGGSDIHDEPISVGGGSESAIQQGRALDGNISGATVFADANGDGVYEAGEATATTDALGRYNFTTPASGPIIVTGGTDVTTGLAFTGTLIAPAGSLVVSPLSTLVQKLVAGGTALADAQLKVSAAFGLSADADFTTLDPARDTLESLADGPAAFVASTTVQDVVSLATAAGATGDLYADLASEIAAATGTFDPTSVASIEGLGLSGDTATATSALAAAGQALAMQQVVDDAGSPATLLSNGADIELTEQGAAATALKTAVAAQDPTSVVAAYTGANLAAATGVAAPISNSPCFVSGSKIRSPHGDIAVETLAVGDMLMTAGGEACAVKWLGHRRVDCRRHPKPHDVWPVRISPGAFGEGLPNRRLWLSPDHSVFVDGVLIPIRHLINGATIVQEARDVVTYWHIELARHDVLLAEGLPCESYLDTGNRSAFANGGASVQMHADFALRIWRAKACAPLVRAGAGLEAARSFLLERAEALGHATTGEPGLHLVACGQDIAADIRGRRYRFALPARASDVRVVSRSAIPAQVRDDSDDHRQLGVAVSRLWIRGALVSLTDLRLGGGWHGREEDGGDGAWRWTDGDAGVAVAGGGTLEIEVAMTERYWLARSGTDASILRRPAKGQAA